MSADPDAFNAINASDCASDALFNSQALQRKRMRDESATLAEQATTMAACFNTLITVHLQCENPALIDERHLPDGMMTIRTVGNPEALAGCIEFVPHLYETVPAASRNQTADSEDQNEESAAREIKISCAKDQGCDASGLASGARKWTRLLTAALSVRLPKLL
jgi:hypothetical protein